MDFAIPHAADSLAANESEISRIGADLSRAVALLTAHGIAFTGTPNRATPWVKPMDNSVALAARNEGEAQLAAEMDRLCGPTAFHRNASTAARG